ncbi:MAG: hypothetical protein ACK4FS_10450 [Flavobacterium sp.]
MKKLIYSLSIVILFSCSNENNNNENVNSKHNQLNTNFRLNENDQLIANQISEEAKFIELVIEMQSFKDYIAQKIELNNLTLADVQSELEALNDLNLNYEDQIAEINNIYKENVEQRYNEHLSIYNNTWFYIKEKYEIEDIEILEEASFLVAQRYLSADVGCGWRYYLCIGAATAAAVLCHGGCNTTALATTAGLGIPACVWACGTIQISMSVGCYDNYCD